MKGYQWESEADTEGEVQVWICAAGLAHEKSKGLLAAIQWSVLA